MLWYKQFLTHMKKWYRHQIHISKSTDNLSILTSNTVRFDFRYVHQIIPWKSIMWATHLITLAICLTLITYFESSAPGFIILVHLATCRIVGKQIRNHNPGTLCVMTTAGGIHKEGNIMDDSNPNRTTYQSTTREGSSHYLQRLLLLHHLFVRNKIPLTWHC
jgi:hypothetical protein